MFDQKIAGIMLRRERLLRNWSRETLSKGICSVSYLSKIEQGKADADEQLLAALFEKLEITWQEISQEESAQHCEMLYELAFADEAEDLMHYCEVISNMNPEKFGAYCKKDPTMILEEIHPLLDNRQRCLVYLTEEKPIHAMHIFPCALSALYAGVNTYAQGDYVVALEYLQNGYHLAASEGYARIMMYYQAYMANCYADMQNIPGMLKHHQIVHRLANALGKKELLRDIEYNLRCTQMECGEYEAPYDFFAKLEKPSVLELHKLAICCEMRGSREEALSVIEQALNAENITETEENMCQIVRYRLNHPEYLKDREYGIRLLQLYEHLKKECPAGFSRFHLPWVEEWCTTNRQYRMAYEILRDFL